MKKDSQNQMVLKHLQAGAIISPFFAAKKYGIYRLSARIYDLKKQGHKINTAIINEGSAHWAIYSM